MIRNPKQEFVAKLEETRTKSQMADSFSSMVLPSSTLNNPFMSTWERGLGLKCRMNPMGGMAPMAPMGGMGAQSGAVSGGVESAKEAKGETTQKAEEEAPPGFDDDEAPPGL